jgi:hypothetical protein
LIAPIGLSNSIDEDTAFQLWNQGAFKDNSASPENIQNKVPPEASEVEHGCGMLASMPVIPLGIGLETELSVKSFRPVQGVNEDREVVRGKRKYPELRQCDADAGAMMRR